MRLPSPPKPTIAPTVASDTAETVAIRSPAMAAGRASGSSTVSSRRMGPYPMPRAACRVSSGTARSPARMFRTSRVSEYRTRPATTRAADSPYTGRSSENMASDGIV